MFLGLGRRELSPDVVALFSTHEHSEGRGYQNRAVLPTGEQTSGWSELATGLLVGWISSSGTGVHYLGASG